ncbi:MAG: hypothetical protein ABI533_01765 [Betaproteobacteria bacterium]
MSNSSAVALPINAAAMLAAPRHVWLATLGAVAVTREWAQRDAAPMFRSLVKEGSAVESLALRVVRGRVGSSMRRANAVARDAERGLRSSVTLLADAASSLIRTKLPSVHARIDVQRMPASHKRVAKSAKRAPRAAATATRRAAKKRVKK